MSSAKWRSFCIGLKVLNLYKMPVIMPNEHLTMMTSSNGNIFRVTGSVRGKPLVTGGFPSQRPVTRSFDAFFDRRLNKRLSKQLRRRWFETPSRLSWRDDTTFRQVQCGLFQSDYAPLILMSFYTLTIFVIYINIWRNIYGYCKYLDLWCDSFPLYAMHYY